MNPKQSTVDDCKIITLPKIQNPAGNITALNGKKELSFEIKRVYYLYDIPGGEERGGHAHKELYQLLVAASGSFDVILDDGKNKKTIRLNRPYNGIIIVPGIWRELVNFSSGSICLVLASEYYSESDYYREYIVYQKFKLEI
jgi:hypothetical protein